ncbi:mechanosensitive ion channel family protein [Candidatus Bipolaricaulota bacterium]|nr:mechanosensitive ion channel family protein [Candidatus Bipolaricaulota bacterium]
MLFLNWTFYGNTVWAWLLALLIMIFVGVVLRVLRGVILHRLTGFAERTATELDDLVADLLKRTRLFFLLVVSLYAGSLALTLPEVATRVISTVTVLVLLIQAGIWGTGLVSFWITRYVRRKLEEDAATATSMTALGFVIKLVLWAVLLLLALDNMGVKIGPLIAGLGIGGIAVALALQNVLGDLFGSLSIVLDKPFVIGDFIIVGDLLGTVERIGLKTTRVRSLYGEQLVFSNSDLLNSRIRNYKRMYERRIVFSIGVTYQTPYEKLAAIPDMIREIIESLEKTRFDRAHFKEYGDFSLKFEIVYYVLTPDYNTYMDIQQAINLAICRRFEKEGIEFAYPTHTLFITEPPDISK